MVKHISYIKRHEGVTMEEFATYWKEVHVPLVKAALPRLKKYVGNFVVEDGRADKWGIEVRGGVMDADLIVELHFDSMDDFQADMHGPGWLNDKRRASSSKLIDYSAMKILITEEFIVDMD
ncbi:MAG: EthD domain-containing protein [Pelagibacterium sp.]|uniref:EthD domain-containing protein n=1 Tax=Pelagibacterium sp. TaxID=1967288 RepID=UPI0032EB868D